MPSALLHEPQAHHVAQQPDRAVEPTLVRQVVPASASSSTGSASSMPSSDQVPDERIAARGLRTGAATNAAAVSWLATACTGGRPGRRGAPARAQLRPGVDDVARTAPAADPGARSAGAPRCPSGRRADRSSTHSCSRWRAGPTASARTGPVRARCAAPRRARAPSSASSWKIVLIGSVWMPVTGRLLAGTRACGAPRSSRRCAYRGSGRAARGRGPRIEQRVVDSPGVHAHPPHGRGRRGEAFDRSGKSAIRFQRTPSGSRTGRFGNRWTTVQLDSPSRSRPNTTRPLAAPRSTAAYSVNVEHLLGWLHGRVGGPHRRRAGRNGAISACHRAFTSALRHRPTAASKSSVSR